MTQIPGHFWYFMEDGDLKKFQEKEFVSNLREVIVAVIEQCAQAVDEIPASASLYENSRTAEAVISFKKQAVAEIRSLADPD